MADTTKPNKREKFNTYARAYRTRKEYYAWYEAECKRCKQPANWRRDCMIGNNNDTNWPRCIPLPKWAKKGERGLR